MVPLSPPGFPAARWPGPGAQRAASCWRSASFSSSPPSPSLTLLSSPTPTGPSTAVSPGRCVPAPLAQPPDTQPLRLRGCYLAFPSARNLESNSQGLGRRRLEHLHGPTELGAPPSSAGDLEGHRPSLSSLNWAQVALRWDLGPLSSR